MKIYQADEARTQKMDEEAEHFRRITMKVLTMQLNSISVMDLVAYGGAACGMLIALQDYGSRQLSFYGCVLILLCAAEFFIPLRLLGSYFHIAMNGMAASEKIFRLLDQKEPTPGTHAGFLAPQLELCSLTFGYQKERPILKDLSLTLPFGSFVGLVGVSGSGKSTLAGLLCQTLRAEQGMIRMNGLDLKELQDPFEWITLVSHRNHLFKGTIRENLQMAKPDASEETLWQALKEVRMDEFVKENGGLDLILQEGAANLSGGQRQRLCLARALLKKTPIYLFDEATSNIDQESENEILQVIHSLKGKHTVIMISHRLDYCQQCDTILVLEDGTLCEQGTHEELMAAGKTYEKLVRQQQALLHDVQGGIAG